jgi:hypothetical protein
MAAKEVKFGADARTRMLEGVDILANAVKLLLVRKAVTLFLKNLLAHRGSLKMVSRLLKILS